MSDSPESIDQHDALVPSTPIRYRIAGWAKQEIQTFGRWCLGFTFLSVTGAISLFVSLSVTGMVLVPQFTDVSSMGLIEMMVRGWQYMSPLVDSMSSIESQFAILLGLCMFWCGAGAGLIYPKLRAILSQFWQRMRRTLR